MAALRPKQRKLVLLWMDGGMSMSTKFLRQIYVQAGYKDGNCADRDCRKAMRAPSVKAAIDEEIVHYDDNLGKRARGRLRDLIESDDEGVALKAAQTGLQMTGAMVQKVQVDHKHTHTLSASDLDAEIKRLWQSLSPQERLQLGFEPPKDVVDAEFVEVPTGAGDSVGQGNVESGSDPVRAATG